METKVFFIGFMGTGKSTIGKLVADKLNLDFVDTDCLIEDELNMSISNIFKRYGEDCFRELEHEIICNLIGDKAGKVIATGGGTPLYHGNMELMKGEGLVIGLDASPYELWLRLRECQDRPLLKKYNTYNEFHRLYKYRDKTYRQAHITIKTGGKSIEEIMLEAIFHIHDFFRSEEK